mmetsp:Transcript_24986/g.53205  ORF Transcript_24986/g.53205 Transcript_24986/m.53205 type:complete len:110 (-) Transcript_24986:20-349(-)
MRSDLMKNYMSFQIELSGCSRSQVVNVPLPPEPPTFLISNGRPYRAGSSRACTTLIPLLRAMTVSACETVNSFPTTSLLPPRRLYPTAIGPEDESRFRRNSAADNMPTT